MIAGVALSSFSLATPVGAEEVVNLDQISVEGALSVIDRPGQPSQVLEGTPLLERQSATTLGGLLDGLPGLSSTWYGPNSNRPVIRGLDAHRVGIYANGLPALDASAVSYDHNAPINPMSIDRVEILRGPEAMLYDGGAAGGIVRTVNNAIPMQPIDALQGRVQLQGNTGFRQRQGAFSLEGGDGRFAWHADGFLERAGDYRAPGGYQGSSLEGDRIRNSSNRQKGGTLGFSMTGADYAIGVSAGQTRDRYGVIINPNTTIDMRSTQFDLKAERRHLDGFVRQVTFEANHSNYQHQELDAGVPATTFSNKGNSARVELSSLLGGVTVQYGLQYRGFEFSALGDESFLPQTRTRNIGLFSLGTWSGGPWSSSLGARVETVRVESDGAAGTGVSRFGPADSRSFTPVSLAWRVDRRLTDRLHLIGSLAHNERAPAFDELYANGPHDATGSYEIGSRDLDIERSNTAEIGVRWQKDDSRVLSATAYVSRYQNYIGLMGTGACRDGDGVIQSCQAPYVLPAYVYDGVRARFTGVELSGRWPVWSAAGHRFGVSLVADWVRADDLTNDQPLPRIAPLSVTPAVNWAYGSWRTSVEARLVARQDRVPDTDAAGPTPGYALVNLRLSRQFVPSFGGGRLAGQWYVALENLTDRTAYSASSIDTMRPLAPMPGRSLKGGVELLF